MPLTRRPSVRTTTDFTAWQRFGGASVLYCWWLGALEESANLGDCTQRLFGWLGAMNTTPTSPFNTQQLRNNSYKLEQHSKRSKASQVPNRENRANDIHSRVVCDSALCECDREECVDAILCSRAWSCELLLIIKATKRLRVYGVPCGDSSLLDWVEQKEMPQIWSLESFERVGRDMSL